MSEPSDAEELIPPKVGNPGRSDERHAELWRAYIRDQLSAAAAAKRMNRLFPDDQETRGSVVAYADRQNWNKRSDDATPVRIQKIELSTVKPSKRKPGPLSRILANADVVDPVDGRILVRSCRWPVGPILPQGEMDRQLFCGEPQDPAVAPYCLKCAAVAYPPAALERKRLTYAENQRP